jgi:hypothetical protein
MQKNSQKAKQVSSRLSRVGFLRAACPNPASFSLCTASDSRPGDEQWRRCHSSSQYASPGASTCTWRRVRGLLRGEPPVLTLSIHLN